MSGEASRVRGRLLLARVEAQLANAREHLAEVDEGLRAAQSELTAGPERCAA